MRKARKTELASKRRGMKILRLLADGCSFSDIARRLKISRRTVGRYMDYYKFKYKIITDNIKKEL